MNHPVSIIWFRQDLRLNHNPALTAACKAKRVLPIYILDDDTAGAYKMGRASRWWLHHSLAALNTSLDHALNVYRGDAATIIADLCRRFEVQSVFWNRCYEPYHIAQSKLIKEQLLSQGIDAKSINGSLLNEPWSVLKITGVPWVCRASSSASMQGAVSRLLDKHQLNTFRECQSITVNRPGFTGDSIS